MLDSAVDLVRALVLSTASACGSLGTAVLLVSFGVRLALLPLSLRLARRARAHQERLAALRPELAGVAERWRQDPERQMRETLAVYRRHGLRPWDPAALLGAAVQWPPLVALFAALRDGVGARVSFLWIGDLGRANLLLTVAVTLLTAAGASLAVPAAGTPDAARAALALLPVLVAAGTFLFLLGTSSTVALSMGAGSAVGLAQGWILRREARRGAAAER